MEEVRSTTSSDAPGERSSEAVPAKPITLRCAHRNSILQQLVDLVRVEPVNAIAVDKRKQHRVFEASDGSNTAPKSARDL